MKNIIHYDYLIRRLRSFFQDQKGFVEIPLQSKLSILPACEEPRTVTTFKLSGTEFPCPQTGQMSLEVELLKKPSLKGLFCQSISYRDEPIVIEGRHLRISPMFEFASVGEVNALKKLESELLIYLGFEVPITVVYEDACAKYDVSIIEAIQEEELAHDISSAILLEKFPERTNPFFTTHKSADGLFNKIDVILHGMGVIGSAERSSNVEEMRELFFTTANGKYAELLFTKFGRPRVLKELEDYLSLPMIPRFTGSIGLTRLEMAMEKAGLFDIPFAHIQPSVFTQPSL